MQGKHLRPTRAQREKNAARKDVRSRRLLPANYAEGQEVEALFMKVRETENPIYIFLVITLRCGKMVSHDKRPGNTHIKNITRIKNGFCALITAAL